MSPPRRRPPRGPDRRGLGATLTAAVMTIAVPGVGHLYVDLLVRGLIWLVGNVALLLILTVGDAGAAALLGVLGALRLAALTDLLVVRRADLGGPRRRRASGGR